MNPELDALKCEWDESTKGHPLLHIEQTYGNGEVVKLWLTPMQAEEVARVIAERKPK